MRRPLDDPAKPPAEVLFEVGVLLLLAGFAAALAGVPVAEGFAVIGVFLVFLPVLIPLAGLALYLLAFVRESEET